MACMSLALRLTRRPILLCESRLHAVMLLLQQFLAPPVMMGATYKGICGMRLIFLRFYSLVLSFFLLSAHAQTSLQASQAQGLAVGSSLSQTMNAQSLSNQATQQGSTNVMGSQYAGSAPQNLKDKSTSTSLFNVGNESRITSTTQVSGQNDASRYDPKRPEEVKYSANRDNQSNEAVYFLDKHPQVKPAFDPNDPLTKSSSYAMNQSTFASSTQKNCQQVTTTQPATVETLSCLMTYSPYIYSCTTENTVSFALVPGCSSNQLLGQYSKNACPGCSDPWMVLSASCANNGAGYYISLYSSTTSIPGSPYRYFVDEGTFVAGSIGSSQSPTFINDRGIGCSFPLYLSQYCDSSNCSMTVSQIGGGGCGGAGFFVSQTYPIPKVFQMTNGTSNNCGPAETLSK